MELFVAQLKLDFAVFSQILMLLVTHPQVLIFLKIQEFLICRDPVIHYTHSGIPISL